MRFNSGVGLKVLKLFRCTIIDEDNKYFIGKDVELLSKIKNI